MMLRNLRVCMVVSFLLEIDNLDKLCFILYMVVEF